MPLRWQRDYRLVVGVERVAEHVHRAECVLAIELGGRSQSPSRKSVSACFSSSVTLIRIHERRIVVDAADVLLADAGDGMRNLVGRDVRGLRHQRAHRPARQLQIRKRAATVDIAVGEHEKHLEIFARGDPLCRKVDPFGDVRADEPREAPAVEVAPHFEECPARIDSLFGQLVIPDSFGDHSDRMHVDAASHRAEWRHGHERIRDRQRARVEDRQLDIGEAIPQNHDIEAGGRRSAVDEGLDVFDEAALEVSSEIILSHHSFRSFSRNVRQRQRLRRDAASGSAAAAESATADSSGLSRYSPIGR